MISRDFLDPPLAPKRGFVCSGCPQFDGPGNYNPSAGLLAANPTPASAFLMAGDFTMYMWINPVSRSERCSVRSAPRPRRSGLLLFVWWGRCGKFFDDRMGNGQWPSDIRAHVTTISTLQEPFCVSTW